MKYALLYWNDDLLLVWIKQHKFTYPKIENENKKSKIRISGVMPSILSYADFELKGYIYAILININKITLLYFIYIYTGIICIYF